MPEPAEAKQSFLDNPEKTTAAVTAGVLAVFAVVHEFVPAHHQDAVKILASLDLMVNLATWRAVRQSLHAQNQEEIIAEEVRSTQPRPEAA
jgi:hypothetical protein